MNIEEVLVGIKDKQTMLNLLKDLTTPQELKALQERLDIVFLLRNGLSYAEISKQTGASTTTVTRVARFLKQESYGGYRWVLENIKK